MFIPYHQFRDLEMDIFYLCLTHMQHSNLDRFSVNHFDRHTNVTRIFICFHRKV